jgi:tetratricopeptide (TPR) repeat protein
MPHSEPPYAEIGMPTTEKPQFSDLDFGFIKWRDVPGFPAAPREPAVNLNNFQSVWSISTINGDIDDSAVSATLAEASRAFSLGRSHQATSNLNEAVSEFFRAIDLFTKVKDKPSLRILEALVNVTDIYRDQDLLPKYISTCQQLIAWKKEIFGEISPSSLQSTFELAKVLFETSMYSEAEELFGEALAGFETLRMNEQYLHCQHFLGESLRYQGRYAEAESRLVSVLAWCLQRGSKDLMVLVMRSLEIIYFKRGPSHSMLAARILYI